MKMEITVKIKNEDGAETIKPVVIDTEIPGYDDYKGPDSFLQDFDVCEKAVIKLRDEAVKEAMDAYLADISKKKLQTKPKSKKGTK